MRKFILILMLITSCSSLRYVPESDDLRFTVVYIKEERHRDQVYLITLKTYYKRNGNCYPVFLKIRTNKKVEIGSIINIVDYI